jgi:lipid-A-disaccharide synthase
MTPDRTGNPHADGARKFFLVAGEASGDRLGGPLIRALRERYPQATFSGVGGAAMAAEGLETLFPIDELAIVGFSAVARGLPLIFRRIGETVRAVLQQRPDVLIIIDSPDFTHRVARRVRAAMPSLSIVDYVSPSVWAWRPGRARAMRAYVDHVLALLPFEPAVHRRLGGPACTYVGHPLAEQADSLRPDATEARRRLNEPPVLLVLPGSRRGELARMTPVFRDALTRIAAAYGPLDAILPTTPHWRERLAGEVAQWPVQPRVVADEAEKMAAFRVARAALAKSGTVTLELAVAGVPMVTAYKVSRVEEAIARRLIKVPSVILANLVLGDNVVPEFLQDDCTPVALAEAVLPLLRDTAARRAQIEAFARLDAIMEIGAASPSARAADVVVAVMTDARHE